MNIFANLALRGLATGAVYALVGMGIVLILQTTNVMNFAQGDTGMFVAYLAFFMLSSAKVPYALVLVLAIAAGASLGLEPVVQQEVNGGAVGHGSALGNFVETG